MVRVVERGGKMALEIPCLAVRGSTGVSFSYGPPGYQNVPSSPKDDGKDCKAMTFSPDGRYFAWKNKGVVKIALCNTWQIVGTINNPKICAIKFSTLGNYFMTWEPFTVSKEKPEGSPQLHIWKSENGELVKSFTQKRQRDWEPQWSCDEKICAIFINSEVFFYENADFDKYVHKINISKTGKFEIGSSVDPYNIVCYMPEKKEQPSFVRMFKYPEFEIEKAVASKSFFQADRVEFCWNKFGNSVLIQTSMDSDKSNSSYYGKQSLHYIDSKGETAMIPLSPIHSIAWSTKKDEFCVIHGHMPAQATLFNTKCESVFEFGPNHRNSIYYSPHGNMLLLGGFGNLRGNVEVWDMNNKKLIAETQAPDTTLLNWSPDGEHFMTATTAPRLRIANGYKIWHYTGSMLYERPWSKEEELWEVLWKSYPVGTFSQKPISYKAVEGITPSQPQASKQAYRPPSARGESISKLRPTPLPTKESFVSKTALKARKKREAKKAKKELEGESPTANGQDEKSQKASNKSVPAADLQLTNDPEKNKKIKKIKVKLEQITKLKELQTSGKHLEINQLDKIKKENELVTELKELLL